MKIFLSYSSRDRPLVEPIHLALCDERHDVFFDRADLLAGEEYDIRIRQAIENADLFLFMVSPESLSPGCYTLTELDLAEKTWLHPADRVLPVILHPVPFDQIPPYLKAVTVLEPEGNVAASVAAAVHRIAVARRRATLKRFATGLAVALLLALCGLAAAFYATHRKSAPETTGKDGAPAVLVPAGSFTMGDDEDSPRREVFVDAFYLDKFEVTTARYAKFLQATGSVNPPEGWEEVKLDRDGALPVAGVDWRDADAYCRWAARRLPTDAEWEKAARGTDGRTYPWGNDPPTPVRANFGEMAGKLAAVGTHPTGKSPCGAEDLAGNVSEWVADGYSDSFPVGDVRNPKTPENGQGRVIRGGGWHDPPNRVKATQRYHASPENRADDIGFRCARDVR